MWQKNPNMHEMDFGMFLHYTTHLNRLTPLRVRYLPHVGGCVWGQLRFW